MTSFVAQILWHAPRLWPLAAVVAAATVVGVLVFYGPQARRLRQPWRWGLPLLRIMVGLALAASIAQPALVRSESAEDPGAVVVLVDASRSMDVLDARTPAQRVAIADALGVLPEGSRSLVAGGLSQRLDALLKLVDDLTAARAEVEYAKLSGQGVIAAQTRYDELASRASALAAQLAAGAQALPQDGAADLAAKLAALSPPSAAGAEPAIAAADYRARVTAARGALGAVQAQVDAKLYERPDVRSICDELATLSRAQLARRAIDRAKGGVLSSLPADGLYAYTFADTLEPLADSTVAASRPVASAGGSRSDIAGAVRAASDRMKGRLVQAVVLLTDGRQVGGDSGGVASSLAGAGVPVYAVAIGSPAPRDVSIVGVSLPQRQFVGETGSVRVQLRGAGMKGKSVNVKLDAARQGQSKTITFSQTMASAEFPLKLDAAAVHDVTVAATPQEGEVTTANNTVRRRVVATPDRATVALVGASASWDFQYLRSALSHASWATVDAEVLDAPGARWSIATSELLQRSAVILSDVTAAHLSPRQWDALYQFVADHGGSVIFIAGRNTASPEFIDSPLLTDLLPFRAGSRPAWRTWPGEQPLFRFQPAPGAADVPALRLGDDASSASAERWLALPALFQYLPVTDLKPNTTPLLIERESGLAVLTESRLGLGRVLFFGASETWRWRRAAPSAVAAEHQWFWQQLVRHVVDDPYAVRRGPLRLDADRVAIEPGQSLRVRAKVLHTEQPPPSESTQPLLVLRDGVQVADVSMNRDPAAAGRYTATLDNLAAGTYELRFRDPLDASVVAVLPVHVEADEESEIRDVSADLPALRRLAESTGGALLPLSEWNTLPRRLREARQTNRQVAEQRLWDSPQLFAFVLGCLGLEWAMRKRLGLA